MRGSVKAGIAVNSSKMHVSKPMAANAFDAASRSCVISRALRQT